MGIKIEGFCCLFSFCLVWGVAGVGWGGPLPPSHQNSYTVIKPMFYAPIQDITMMDQILGELISQCNILFKLMESYLKILLG